MNVSESVDKFCQKIWSAYEKIPQSLPAEVTVNNLGTGIIVKTDEDGLYFEANGDEFDVEEWFMENNFASDHLDIQPLQKESRPN